MMTSFAGSTSGSGHSAPQSKEELTLSSFAALLSSAQLTGNDRQQPLLASHEPALARLVSPHSHTHGSDAPRCTFSSLKLKNNVSASQASHLMPSSSLQDSASLNLAIPVAMTRGEVEQAPVLLLNNITESFEALVASRLRSSVLALYQTFKTLSHGSISPEAKAMLDILKPRKKPIKFTTTVTSFRVLPALESGQSVRNINADGSVLLPLVFEAIIDVSCLGTQVAVSLKAPGTVAGALNPADSLIDHSEVAFDSIQLLQSMMKHARSVVKKAIAVACGMAPKISYSYSQVESSSAAQPHEVPSYGSKLSHANLEHFNANGKRRHDQVGTSRVKDENDVTSTQHEMRRSSHHPALHQTTTEGSGHDENDEQEALPRRLSNLSEYQPEDEVPNTRNAEFNFFNSKAPWMQPQPPSSFSSENSIMAALARSKGSRGSMVNSYFDLNKANHNLGSIDEKDSGSTKNADFSSLAPTISIRDLYSKFDLGRAAQQQPNLSQDHLSKKKRVSFMDLKECST